MGLIMCSPLKNLTNSIHQDNIHMIQQDHETKVCGTHAPISINSPSSITPIDLQGRISAITSRSIEEDILIALFDAFHRDQSTVYALVGQIAKRIPTTADALTALFTQPDVAFTFIGRDNKRHVVAQEGFESLHIAGRSIEIQLEDGTVKTEIVDGVHFLKEATFVMSKALIGDHLIEEGNQQEHSLNKGIGLIGTSLFYLPLILVKEKVYQLGVNLFKFGTKLWEVTRNSFTNSGDKSKEKRIEEEKDQIHRAKESLARKKDQLRQEHHRHEHLTEDGVIGVTFEEDQSTSS